MGGFTIVCVRHGQSEFNAKNMFCGWVDANLTAQGEQEARDTADKVKNAGLDDVDVVYTSGLTRAQETAAIVLDTLGKGVRWTCRVRACWKGIIYGYRMDGRGRVS